MPKTRGYSHLSLCGIFFYLLLWQHGFPDPPVEYIPLLKAIDEYEEDAEKDRHSNVIDDESRTNEELLGYLKNNIVNSARSVEAGLLISRGTSAHGAIVKHLETADESYVGVLVYILSYHSSRIRNRALQRYLQKFQKNRGTQWNLPNIEETLDILSGDGFSDAIPEIQFVANDPKTPPRTRGLARVALNRLKSPDLPDNAKFYYQIDELHTGHEGLPVLEAILNHELIEVDGKARPEGWLTVNELYFSDQNHTIIKGVFSDRPGYWELKIGEEVEGRRAVYFSYFIGNLNAAGFVGVLELVDNRWLVFYWKNIWVA